MGTSDQKGVPKEGQKEVQKEVKKGSFRGSFHAYSRSVTLCLRVYF